MLVRMLSKGNVVSLRAAEFLECLRVVMRMSCRESRSECRRPMAGAESALERDRHPVGISSRERLPVREVLEGSDRGRGDTPEQDSGA